MSMPVPAEVLQERIVDELGSEIVAGDLRPGDRITLQSLQARFGVSRTVVRDGMRVLEAMRLVYPKRRVGLVVHEARYWNRYDPRVIRWRLSGGDRREHFAELTELRIAVEPLAAARAAVRASAADRGEAERLAAVLRRTGQAGDLEGFLEADIAFHTLLLRASGNTMFAALDQVVAEVLTGRTRQRLMPFNPREEALRRHEAVAAALAAGDPRAAEEHMQALVDEVRGALEEDLAGQPGDAPGPGRP